MEKERTYADGALVYNIETNHLKDALEAVEQMRQQGCEVQPDGLCGQECKRCHALRTTPEIEYQTIRSATQAHCIAYPTQFREHPPCFHLHRARLGVLAEHPEAQINKQGELLVEVVLTFYVGREVGAAGRPEFNVQNDGLEPDRIEVRVRGMLANAGYHPTRKAYHDGNLPPQTGGTERTSETAFPAPNSRPTVKP